MSIARAIVRILPFPCAKVIYVRGIACLVAYMATCPQCKKRIAKDLAVCPKCNAQLNGGQEEKKTDVQQTLQATQSSGSQTTVQPQAPERRRSRPLIFVVDGKQIALKPVKLERRKLYGWTEKVALDGGGAQCRLAHIDETGTIVIPSGEMALGNLTEEGEWVERRQLKAYDVEGNAMQLYPSSFDAPIELGKLASYEEYLDHAITAVYILKGEGVAAIIELMRGKKGLYTFKFNFRAGYFPSNAFLVESEGKLFMTTGVKLNFEFIGRTDLVESAGSEEEADEDDDEELDFSMM